MHVLSEGDTPLRLVSGSSYPEVRKNDSQRGFSFMECWSGRCREGVPQVGFIPDPTVQILWVSFPRCPELRFIASPTRCLQIRPPSRGGRKPRCPRGQSPEPGPARLCFRSPQAAGGGPASPAGPGGGDATPGAPEGDAGRGGRFQQRSSPAPGPAGCPGNRVSVALAPGWEGRVDVPFHEGDPLIPVSSGLSRFSY